ncbi:MAG: hypothetical protein AAFS10_06200 [Myxococcota bacterium]
MNDTMIRGGLWAVCCVGFLAGAVGCDEKAFEPNTTPTTETSVLALAIWKGVKPR